MRHAPLSGTLKGIRRTLGVEQKGKTPLLTDDIQKILGHLPDNLRGTRDAALFLVGFAGALRRSELTALTFEDLSFGSEGRVISLGCCNPDQEGKGRKVTIPFGSHRNTCPLRALQKWLDAAQISSGPLFRPVSSHGKVEAKKLHKDSIAGIIEAAVHAAGYTAEEFAGPQSTRGFCDPGRIEWRQRAANHAPNGTPVLDHRAPLHPRRHPLPRRRRGEIRAVKHMLVADRLNRRLLVKRIAGFTASSE